MLPLQRMKKSSLLCHRLKCACMHIWLQQQKQAINVPFHVHAQIKHTTQRDLLCSCNTQMCKAIAVRSHHGRGVRLMHPPSQDLHS